jgi:opacity protein-like surface antigen
MKSIKRAIQLLACGAVAFAVAPSAFAKAQPGFYLGLSAGQSTYDLDKTELDGIVNSAFASVGVPILSRSSTFEDSDTSTALIVGYRFLPYVAIEASYLDLGAAEYRFNGTVNPPGPVASTSTSVSIDTETKGFTLSGIGSIPIGEVFDLHARLGLFIAQTDLSIGVAINTSESDTENFDSQGVLLGFGAGFHLGDHWSLSLDWTKYANVADENDDEDFETEDGFDIDALSISAVYKF